MLRRPFLRIAGLLLFVVLGSSPFVPGLLGADDSLPARLTDQEFWALISDISEPGGYFRSDNLLSNEIGFPYVIPDLTMRAAPGRVYLGVGPEQNFTYIAALEPRMAVIVDIRRGNLDLHLMYKAVFELSANRAEFVSRLFSRRLPERVGSASSLQDIVDGASSATAGDELFEENLAAIEKHLTGAHGFALSPEDLQGIEHAYRAFFTFGPAIQYNSSQGGFGFGGGNRPSYADLMLGADDGGQLRSYMASERTFGVLKDLQMRNMLVPVVGDFAGPKAIRAVGRYLKAHNAMVSAFYLSNVEQFLGYQGSIAFCGNVASLPLDDTSTFIRSRRGGSYGPGYGLNLDLGMMAMELKYCAQ
jgi:hypothetical protein